MKKLVIFLTCLSFFAFAKAQLTGLDLRAGYNVHRFNDEISASFNSGFQFAALVNYEFASIEKFYVSSGLMLSKKGASLEKFGPGTIENPDYIRNYTFRAWYLQLPLIAGIQYQLNEKTKFIFQIGPSFNLNLFGQTDIETSFATHWMLELNKTAPTKEYMKMFDISAIISAGIQYQRYSFHISYDHGFIPVMKNKSTEPTATNAAIQFSVGYSLPFNTGAVEE